MAATTIGTLIVTVTLSILVLFLAANFVPYVQISLGTAKQTFGEVAWSYAYRSIIECTSLALEGFMKTGEDYTCRAVMSLSNPVSARTENGRIVFSTPSGSVSVDLEALKNTLSKLTGYPAQSIDVTVVERGASRLTVEVTASPTGLRVVIEPG